MNVRTYFLCLFFLSISVFSQKNTTATEQDIARAGVLKVQYPTQEVIVEDSLDDVKFGFDSETACVTVSEKRSNRFLSLADGCQFQDYEFYDAQSEITSFKVMYKNYKKKRVNVGDSYYKDEELFHNDVRVKYTNLYFPNKGYQLIAVKEIQYKDIKYFHQLYFNQFAPVSHKKIRFEIPHWLEVELKEMNFENQRIRKEIQETETSKIYTYTLDSISEFSNEKNVPGATYIYPHILLLPKAYSRNGVRTVLFEELDDLYTWYRSIVNRMDDPRKSYVVKTHELIANARTDEDKIKAIYYWVQDNIRYIAFEDGIAGFQPDEASNVFDKKYGDCKGMANLTKQMLKTAGFDARLTWIGTNRIAYDYSTPCLAVDNHMICTLVRNNQYYYLDATEGYNAFGHYGERIQGRQVLIENGENFILERVPATAVNKNLRETVHQLVVQKDDLIGSVKKKVTGAEKTDLFHYAEYIAATNRQEFLEMYLIGDPLVSHVSNLQYSDLYEKEGAMSMTADVKYKNKVSFFEDTFYIDLNIEKEFSMLELGDRKVPYQFGHAYVSKTRTELSLPKGYVPESLPEDISVEHKKFSFDLHFFQTNDKVVYECIVIVKEGRIGVEDFSIWNGAVKEIKKKYEEQLIVRKEKL